MRTSVPHLEIVKLVQRRLPERQGIRDRRQGQRGYDAAKRINGRKRHIVVDTCGLVPFVIVTPADITDRDAAREVLFRLHLMHPEIATVWADSAYAGALVTWAKTRLDVTIGTVRRPPNTSGFVVLPRRWGGGEVAFVDHESTSALPGPRTAAAQVSETLITWESIALMTRRLTRHPTRRRGRRLPVAATA